MSLKKISKDQPDKFEFDQQSLEAAKKILSNYPKGKEKSAVMALLYIAQRQNNNWIPLSAIKYIPNSPLGASTAVYISSFGTRYPSVNNLK